jgi:ABC-type Na+ transport system ATPase subunit NatA
MKKLLLLGLLVGCSEHATTLRIVYNMGCLDQLEVSIRNGEVTSKPKSVERNAQIARCETASYEFLGRYVK